MQYRFILDLRFQAWCTMLGKSGSGVYPPHGRPLPWEERGGYWYSGEKRKIGTFFKPFFWSFFTHIQRKNINKVSRKRIYHLGEYNLIPDQDLKLSTFTKFFEHCTYIFWPFIVSSASKTSCLSILKYLSYHS